ncbi:preprotein translocase subunit SecE [Sessilibacter corallicola]|uniref:Protein translocase subunit SecE n=1 Tax=Sessilibacter corallicola TaxID=2904075 RepID=A0ABQ0AAU8_9GAMM|nr:preprotein translocase subunit SecE [Sessilibacter corallicola]MCE2028125.1 preprotein translocase subunit SecE [Sessilibacter corallicola]
MSGKVEAPEYRFDALKWLVAIAIVALCVIGNSVFSEVSLLWRVPSILVGAAVALFVMAQTEKGAAIWGLLRDAQTEVRKVVWPTKEETNRTTLIVIGVVILMSLILWGLDSLLGWIASLILG